MNRKQLLITIFIFILVLGGLFFVYQSLISQRGTGNTTGITTEGGRDTLFPNFGLFDGEDGEETDEDTFVPTLRQISSTPTAGSVVFNTEEDTVIRYVERATGHIFETANDSLEQTRISNTTIPRIQNSAWAPNGEEVILQYLDENEVLKSFYGEVSSDLNVLEGWFLSNNIINIAVHKDNDIFYIQKTGNNSKGIVSNFNGTNGKTIFSSTIYDWYPQWMGDSTTVTTKASNDTQGFLYKLKSGNYEKIISFDGLSTDINQNGSKILFSISNSEETNLFIYNIEDKEFIEIPFKTLAEKCVWSTDTEIYCGSPYEMDSLATYPDDWYKGKVFFKDDIWSYDIETDTAALVFDAEAQSVPFDAINLTIDDEGKTLLFTNKDDLTLWALTLKQKVEETLEQNKEDTVE